MTITNGGVEPEARPPIHASPWLHVSKMEMKTDGDSRIFVDPETAHAVAGDPGYQRRLPGSCALCQAEALAEAAQAQQEEELNG